ncbi:hypothetical protein MOF05_22585, partial [Bacillus haynesii]|uniref:hypothetical protein n=1 Tax=Bacillus haynesii TaxID=1925021 RepID=UPI002282364E
KKANIPSLSSENHKTCLLIMLHLSFFDLPLSRLIMHGDAFIIQMMIWDVNSIFIKNISFFWIEPLHWR